MRPFRWCWQVGFHRVNDTIALELLGLALDT